MLAAINGVELLSGDVAGAYLNAQCKEKVYFTVWRGFGHGFGNPSKPRYAVIVKALYSLKTCAFVWRKHLSNMLRKDLGFPFALLIRMLGYGRRPSRTALSIMR